MEVVYIKSIGRVTDNFSMRPKIFILLSVLLSFSLHAQEAKTTSLIGFKKEKVRFVDQIEPFAKKEEVFPHIGKATDYTKLDFKPARDEFVESYKKNATKGCADAVFGEGLGDKSLDSIIYPLVKLQCNAANTIRDTKELTPDTCVSLAGCLKSKIDFRSADAAILFRNARAKAARDMIALTSKSGITEMIEYETLKNYAAKKYGKDFVPESCGQDILEIPSEKGRVTCNTRAVDEGYELAQSICKIPEAGCNFDYLDYIKQNKREDEPSQSLLSGYIAQTSQKRAEETMDQDTQMLKEIALILADSSRPAEKRTEMAMMFIYKNYLRVDPVLRSYYDRSVANKSGGTKDPISEGLLSYVQRNENKSPEEILTDLENLRKSEAKSLLAGKCGNINTMAKLCSAVDDVTGNATVIADKREFDKLIARKPEITKPMMSLEDMASNVARCNTFNLFTTSNGIARDEIKLSMGQDLFTDGDGASFKSELSLATQLSKKILVIDNRGAVSKSHKEFTVIAATKLSENKEKEKGSDLLLVKSFSRNAAALPEVYRKGIDGENGSSYRGPSKSESAEVAPKIASLPANNEVVKSSIVDSYSMAQKNGMMANKGASSSAQQAISNNVSFIPSAPSDNEGKAQAATSVKKAQYDQMTGKISELEDRLASAQKRIADGDKGSDIKKDSSGDDQSSLIAELKNARNTLAEMKKQREAKEAQAVAQSRTSVNEFRNEQNDSSGEARESYRENSSSGNNSMRSSGASRSMAFRDSGSDYSEERAGRTSNRGSSSSEDSGNSERAESIVLTKVDGTTHAKLNQTIKDLIYAEFGKPFYIEENGMVKQIIPEVVDGQILLNADGTPIYKTIVKGKVGEFKVDFKDKKANPKVARQDSAADVKISDEQTAPAVRYRDLRDILERTTNN